MSSTSNLSIREIPLTPSTVSKLLGCLYLALQETNCSSQLYVILAKLHIIRFTKNIRIQGSNFHGQLFRVSGWRRREKKNWEYSSSAPNKSRHVNSASKKSQYTVKFGFFTLRNKGVEVWKATMFLRLGFYTGRGRRFHPILSTIKTKQALSLICLNLHFELA